MGKLIDGAGFVDAFLVMLGSQDTSPPRKQTPTSGIKGRVANEGLPEAVVSIVQELREPNDITRAVNGAYCDLFAGDSSQYSNDLSAADFALAGYLIRRGLTPRDTELTMRASGRYRSKWDEPRGNVTWLEHTILRVVELSDESQQAVGSNNEAVAINDGEWSEPRELGEELLPVEPFNPELLPATFREWVCDTSERMQAPLDFLAISAMVGAGAVIGNKIGIQPKQSDIGWIEVPNLWGAIVGRPSSMKSPALEAMLAPVMSLEAKALQSFEAQLPVRQFELAKYEADKKAFGAKLKKGQAVQSDMPIEPQFEQQRRYVANDTTFQKLGVLCAENPNGLLIFQDELSGLLEGISCQGQEGARAFYLTAWNGRQSYTFDRIGRGTTLISKLCLSVLGGFQPAKLSEHLGGAVTGGHKDDGLAQRFQLLVYPDPSESWLYIDRSPKYDFKAVEEVFERLDTLEPAKIGAEDMLGRNIPILKFDGEAQETFIQILTKLELRLRRGDLDPALESHLAKYRKLIPALALLIHLIDVGHGPVGIGALKKAWGWSKYLKTHARRVYAVATGIKDRGTRSLMQLVESGALTDGFTAREVYRKGRSGLTRQEDAQEAIDALIELGWLRVVSDPVGSKPGRPSFRYVINPKIRRAA
jgi:putative DNA primase/helicase